MSTPAASDLHGGILLGLDAGTSMIKCVAFSIHGDIIASDSVVNEYTSDDSGAAVQNMEHTREQAFAVVGNVVRELGPRSADILALAVTGQGDGMWLVDADGKPVQDGWLWLDSRSAELVTEVAQSERFERLFEITGTALNAAQARSQLLWMETHAPELLDRAATLYHPKDYLYQELTGERATDPSEALFTFGDFRTGAYAPETLELLGLGHRSNLLPGIVDGVTSSSPILPEVAQRTGLPTTTRVNLGYVDVICSALGGGLYARGNNVAMTLLGTTGIHMRYSPGLEALQLPQHKTGYTIAFPGGGFAQLQTNMSATLNIDWLVALIQQADSIAAGNPDKRIPDPAAAPNITAERMLDMLDQLVSDAGPAARLFHPYISVAGERGPFFDAHARASFSGLDINTGFAELARSVYEGLCFAARDCYAELGELPPEIRVSGGGARSRALRQLLATITDRPVRSVERAEAGAAGAAMMSAVQLGVFDNVASCVATWVEPAVGEAIKPDTALTQHYDDLFGIYQKQRQEATGHWQCLAGLRGHLPEV